MAPLFRRGSMQELLLLVAGVFACYLAYGYIQEKMFTAGLKPYTWYATLLQFMLYGCFGRLEMMLRRLKRSSLPLRLYAFLGFLSVTTMGCSNASLKYLNYPTHVVFKSSKLIPVMVSSFWPSWPFLVIVLRRFTSGHSCRWRRSEASLSSARRTSCWTTWHRHCCAWG